MGPEGVNEPIRLQDPTRRYFAPVPEPFLRVVNARQHNLKGVTVELPHRKLIVITGPSGSGKSSLAFDTIYAEGQRRYIESLSTYAKQFLERMPKPLVDRIEGIAPAIAIEQRNPTVSSRSTVGTATEVYDYLRLLWARVGVQYCRVCGARVVRDSPATAADGARGLGQTPIQIAFPLPDSARQSHAAIADNLRAMGFVRIQLGGVATHLDDLPTGADLSTAPDLLIVVDRLTDPTSAGPRLEEAIAQAMAEGDGVAVVLHSEGRLRFTEHPACSTCDTPAFTLSPGLFSFNNPRGACAGCNGFGAVLEYDESLIVPDPKRSLLNGAIDPWTKPRYESRRRLLYDTARKLGADPSAPWDSLKATVKRELLYGRQGRFLGVFPFLTSLEEKRYKQYVRVFLRRYQLAKECPACHGSRLNEQALAVRIGSNTIAEVGSLALTEMRDWLARLELNETQRRIAQDVLTELVARVEYLTQVGLGYLTLDRQTRTLSGGEAQRISLANALGARLVDSLYVLDEPSIGLHPRDTDRLLGILERLRDAGNTVVVVEHDLEAIRRADHMVELGPASGERGGRLVYAGPPTASTETVTGQYLTGTKRIGVPSGRRPLGARRLRITGARLHNLASVDVEIPLGTLVAVTGVSGSGKSTLVHDVIYRQLESQLTGESSVKAHLGEVAGAIDTMSGHEWIQSVVMIDLSPIGRTPRSNPITYVKGFDEIRELFADQPLSRSRRYTPATFSFNTAGGRCEQCDGAGQVMVEMVFLADVFVPCEACGGTRFKREVLDVKVRGHSIHDVLQWTVDEAIGRFRHQPKLGAALWQVQQVGLGYLRLGQAATTLSGGEAQRLKIARELIQASKRSGRKLYLLDEPTTGLHLDDVRQLITVLDRLVDAGNTVLVIEHHLDVVKRADWVIDLGPDAGPAGGRIVVQGPPELVAATPGSETGRFLKPLLASAP